MFAAVFIKGIARILCNYRGSLTSLKESLLRNKGKSSSNSLAQEIYSTDLRRVAYSLFESFKELYVDLNVPNEVREKSRQYFLHKLDAREALEVVSFELTFVYELLFTKAMMMQNMLGKSLYFIPIICEVSALVAWSCIDKHIYRKLDVNITYTLLVLVVAADTTPLIHATYWYSLSHIRRAKEYIQQFNFFDICEDEIPSDSLMLHQSSSFRSSEVYTYTYEVQLAGNQLELLYQELRHRSSLETSENPYRSVGQCINLANYKPRVEELSKLSSIISTSERTYDETLLLWHIATDLCYLTEAEEKMQEPEGLEVPQTIRQSSKLSSKFINSILGACMLGRSRTREAMARHYKKFWGRKTSAGFVGPQTKDEVENSKSLSDYMLYLLLVNSKMMVEVAAMGEMRFRATITLAEELYAKLPYTKGKKYSDLLQKVSFDQELSDEGNSVWFAACRLAIELKELDKNKVINLWEVISKVWVEMLFHGAAQSSASAQVDQLFEGGEFLTGVVMDEAFRFGKS